MKKYKPILFSTPMVEAILEGRKMQTRRIVKKKYSNTDLEFRTDKYGTALVEIQNDVPPPTKMPDGKTKHRVKAFELKKTKYQVGDILWVRETWDYYETSEEYIDENTIEYRVAYAYKALNTQPKINDIQWVKVSEDKYWKAQEKIDDEEAHDISRWKPSIHMPRSAARIFLEVVSVRAERLQDISERDAFAEGVIKEHNPIPAGATWSDTLGKASLKAFQSIWKDIHGEKNWDENPFVWIYEFKRIEKPKDF